MAFIHLPERWMRQPQGRSKLNSSHWLADSIVSLVVSEPGAPRDVITNQRFAYGGSGGAREILRAQTESRSAPVGGPVRFAAGTTTANWTLGTQGSGADTIVAETFSVFALGGRFTGTANSFAPVLTSQEEVSNYTGFSLGIDDFALIDNACILLGIGNTAAGMTNSASSANWLLNNDPNKIQFFGAGADGTLHYFYGPKGRETKSNTKLPDGNQLANRRTKIGGQAAASYEAGLALGFVLRGVIPTQEQFLELRRAPWQLLAPEKRRIYLPAAGGTQSFSYTATGGLTFAGTSALLRKRTPVAAGGLTFAGTSALLRKRTPVAAGGLMFAGASTVAYHEAVRTVTASGGIIFGGTAGYGNLVFGAAPSGIAGRLMVYRTGALRQPR